MWYRVLRHSIVHGRVGWDVIDMVQADTLTDARDLASVEYGDAEISEDVPRSVVVAS